ncbi:hypothetical protein EB001_12665, partial [bacterium]|nr:hypothetical protein [bacterium]
MSVNFVYGSGNPQYVEPKTSQSSNQSQQLSPELLQFAQQEGLNLSDIQSGVNQEPLKSGIYTQTSTSRKMPDDAALIDNINEVYKRIQKRDANDSEIAIWLPILRNKYKSKDGASKTTIKYTYKNGELLSTDYLTADNQDPKMWLENEIKNKLLTSAEETVQVGIPEGPAGQYFTAFKEFAYKNGIQLSDSAALDYANKV